MKSHFSENTRLNRISGIVRIPAAALALVAWMMLLGLITGSGVANAQNTNGTLHGQVLDPTGAIVPDAQVVVVNEDTGTTDFNGKSDSAGIFVAVQLIPGPYKITVTAKGLKASVVTGVMVTVAQVTSVDVHMEIGAVTSSVTVSAKGEQLDTSTSDISTLITPTDVQNLPLAQRTTENLLSFIPGVAHGGSGDQPSMAQLSVDGSRTLNSEEFLNGVSTIIASTGQFGTLPSPDAIDSFRVLATNAPAEYGRTAGAVISVNTISGTNTYHGNLYFLAQNTALNANTYFNKLNINPTTLQPQPRPPSHFYQAGGSLGGAVRIPHLYNGHDKTFFFVNYDKTIQPSSTLVQETVPPDGSEPGTTNWRVGDFSQAGTPPVYLPGSKTSAQFPGNKINTPLDPAAKAIMALIPAPNTIGVHDLVDNRYTNNWSQQQTFKYTTLKFVTRVDEVVTPKDRVSFNVYYFSTQQPQTVSFGVPLLNNTWGCTCNNAWLPSVDYTRMLSPSMVMDLNMGFFRNLVVRVPPGVSPTASSQLGIASLPLSQTPDMTDPGFSQVGPSTNVDQVNISNTYTPFGTVTKTFGPHTFKFGASLRKNEFNSFNPATYPEGQFAFDGSITNHGTAGIPGNGVADFLLGQVKTAQYEQVMPETGRRNYNLGVFFQDDWRFNSKLTLNLGLRWEYESPMTIATNVYSRINPYTFTMLAAGLNGTSNSLNIVTPKADFSPRFGFAYSLNNKTVFRGAFGEFYGTIFQNLGGQLAYPGFDNTITYNNVGTALPQPFTLSQGMPIQPPSNLNVPFGPVLAATAATPYSPAVSFNDLDHMPLVQQWSFGVERQLPLAVTMEVNYLGNHAIHLSYVQQENIVPLASVVAEQQINTSLATQNASPFPAFKSFITDDNIGRSNYNSLQVSVRRNFTKGLYVLSNYTFAKSLDDGSTIYNFSAPNGTANSQYPVDNPNRIRDMAVSNIDTKHSVAVGLVYSTPGKYWWLRDWRISPEFFGRTGIPLNISQTNEIPGASERPNGNAQLLKIAPYVNGNSLQYLDPVTDTAHFPLTASGPVFNTISGTRTLIVPLGFGNVPRDALRVPGEADFDASVEKNFKIFERLGFQFRVDAFNVINHANFTSPSGSLAITEATATPTVAGFTTSTGFGKITGTQASRFMQASGRFYF